MNIKFIPTLLLFAFFISACGGNDTSLPYDYPLEANFTGISSTTAIKVFSKTDGAVTEISADSTDLDSHQIFSGLEADPGFTQFIFKDKSNASLIKENPASTIAVTYTLSSENIFFTQPFGAIPDCTAFGNPAAFQVECVAYAISSASGNILTSSGTGFDSEEALKSLMKAGDTLAYLTYFTEYRK